MATISERLRDGAESASSAASAHRQEEAADTIDALVAALEKARHWCPSELRDGQIDAALALARGGK